MRKIGIIVADDGELAPFVEKLENADNIGYFGRSCYTFEVGGNTVILTHSGIGKVNAAAAAMFLHFNGCDTIFNYGYSGGISGVSKGSIVIADKFLEHDFDLVCLGYKLCQKPGQEYIYSADEHRCQIPCQGSVHPLDSVPYMVLPEHSHNTCRSDGLFSPAVTERQTIHW